MRAALDQRHPDAEAGEELRQLDGHRAAAQHDEGFGEAGQAEGRVTGEIAHVLKLRQRRRGDDRAGGNDETRGGELVARAQFERVRVGKAGEGAQELELAVDELLPAVIGKVLDQGVLARHDLGEVEADILRADAPRLRVAGQVHDFGRVEQGLGRHAAAQDAKAADFLAALKDHGFKALGHGGPCRGVAAAAAADHRKVIIESFSSVAHGRKMREAHLAGKG